MDTSRLLNRMATSKQIRFATAQTNHGPMWIDVPTPIQKHFPPWQHLRLSCISCCLSGFQLLKAYYILNGCKITIKKNCVHQQGPAVKQKYRNMRVRKVTIVNRPLRMPKGEHNLAQGIYLSKLSGLCISIAQLEPLHH